MFAAAQTLEVVGDATATVRPPVRRGASAAVTSGARAVRGIERSRRKARPWHAYRREHALFAPHGLR